MELGLQGKTALITGGSKGIGYAIAELLASEGCHLHLAARTEADLVAAADTLRGRHNINVETHTRDLSRSQDIARLGKTCKNVDILFNNAGAVPRVRLLEMDEAAWREAWELKVFGYINLTRHIYGAMKTRGDGVIVNIVGNSAGNPHPSYAAGTAANTALDAFTIALGRESQGFGVRVLGIHPGITRTQRQADRYYARAEAEFGDRERWAELLPEMPFGRPTEPEEVADFAVFWPRQRHPTHPA